MSKADKSFMPKKLLFHCIETLVSQAGNRCFTTMKQVKLLSWLQPVTF